ncbi:hypothetical protein NW754_003887 [Fusarium falciforme]|nr:hypothetical protein NW754_003887 [Fusarium falciforme]
MVFKKVDDIILHADVYYPPQVRKGGDENQIALVALMIHGGGHVTLTRKDIRLDQVSMALDRGFVVVSIDYRLCPEVTLAEGPMADTVDALAWIRNTLPTIPGKRPDVRLDGEKVVAIGWSSGGHLAMSLSWTSISRRIRPPDAILAFYCPTDYADPFWLRPNIPRHTESIIADVEQDEFDDKIWSGMSDQPLPGDTASMNGKHAADGGTGSLSTEDRRARLLLYMSRHGKTLDILLNGLGKKTRQGPVDSTEAQIEAISPLAQIRNGAYTTPTFIIHPRQDNLLPLEQSLRTYKALVAAGVETELRIVENSSHLFDAFHGWDRDRQAFNTVLEGYRFIYDYVG